MRRLTAYLVPLTLTLFLGLASAAGAGIYYESNTTSDASKTAQKVRAWVDGPRSKVEFLSGKNKDLLAPGNYLLTTDGGEVLYLVDPKEKTYQVWDLEALMATFGTVMEGMQGVIDFQISDFETEKLLEEAGDTLLGRSTKHVRWRTSYTFEMKIIGMKRSQEVEMVQDSWITSSLTDAGFGAWLRSDRFKTGFEDIDRLISEEMKKIDGFPLKSVVVTTSRNKKGKETTSRSTTEVTTLREESIAPSIFEIPEGYERIEIAPE